MAEQYVSPRMERKLWRAFLSVAHMLTPEEEILAAASAWTPIGCSLVVTDRRLIVECAEASPWSVAFADLHGLELSPTREGRRRNSLRFRADRGRLRRDVIVFRFISKDEHLLLRAALPSGPTSS
jgi:hypothetical protein